MNALKKHIITKYAPENVNIIKWLNGKATRDDVCNYLSEALTKLNEIQTEMMQGLQKIDNSVKSLVAHHTDAALKDITQQQNQLFSSVRITSLQISTLLRVAAEGTPGGVMNARKKFAEAVHKEMDMANFIDSLVHTKGNNYAKTIPEKIDLLLEWNSKAENVTIDFDPIGMQQYIVEHKDDITSEKIILLERTFNFTADVTTDVTLKEIPL